MNESSHFPANPFGDWDGSPAAARALQQTLADLNRRLDRAIDGGA